MRAPWPAGSWNGGIVGQATTFSAATTFNAATTTTVTSVGTDTTAGATVKNTTAAAAGAQQYSPMLVLTGQGWKTNATAASQQVDIALQNETVQGAANPTGILRFRWQVASGGYSTIGSLDTAGTFTTTAVTTTGTTQSTATSTFAFYAPNGGVRVKGATGYDSDLAEALIIGATTATGVRVGKSGGSVGFYAATPVARAAHIADPAGGATVDAEARTAINAILVAIENIGITLTS